LDDAKILYDQPSQRWVACAIDLADGSLGSQNVILAVSKDSTPVPLAGNWTKYLVAIARPGSKTDSSTLAVDANGIYISAYYFHGGDVNDGHEVVAIKKPDIYQGTYVATFLYVTNTELNTLSITPVVNFDTSRLGSNVWFVAKGPSTGQGTNYKGGPLQYRRLSWNTNSTAQWLDTSWLVLPEPQPTYLDYFDLDGPIIYAPQLTGAGMSLQRTGSRLRTPIIRNSVLWVCQHIGLDGTDGDYGGNETGSTVDRSAIQWLKLQLNSAGTPLTHLAHGRIYDTAATYPYYYYMPSLVVSANGDMVTGFSGSRSTEYVGAFYFGRLADGTTSGSPMLVQAGTGASPIAPYWGDYSYTCLDPDGSIWTVQEYAFAPSGVYWGTWITQINR